VADDTELLPGIVASPAPEYWKDYLGQE
jgi:hypothetical protein